MKKLLFLLLMIVSLSFSATWYVNVTGSDVTGDGSATNPYFSFSKAYNSSSNGDTVIFQNGSHLAAGSLTFRTTIWVAKLLYIQGEDCSHPENVNVTLYTPSVNNIFDIGAAGSGGSLRCLGTRGAGTADNATSNINIRTGVGNYTIDNVNIFDLNDSATNGGIVFETSELTHNITIKNIRIYNISDQGIAIAGVAGVKNITVINSNFTMGDGGGSDTAISIANGATTTQAGPFLFENLTVLCTSACTRTTAFVTAFLLQTAAAEVGNRDIKIKNIQIGNSTHPFVGQIIRSSRLYNVTVDNITIVNANSSGTTARALIELEGLQNYVTIENSSYGSASKQIEIANANFLVMDNSNNSRVCNNQYYIYSAGEITFLQAQDFNTSDNVQLCNNYVRIYNVTSASHFGIGSEGGNSSLLIIKNASIINNTMEVLDPYGGGAFHCSFMGTTNNSLMENNTCLNGVYGMLAKGNQNLLVKNNRGYNQTTNSLYDKGGRNTIFKDNQIWSMVNGTYVISADGTSAALQSINITFYNNSINISNRNSTGFVNTTIGFYINSATTQNIFSYNNTYYFDNCTYGFFQNTSGVRQNYSEWQTLTGLEAGSTFVCPITGLTTISIYATRINVSDVVFSSTTYVPIANIQFNTSGGTSNYTILSSLNLEKQTGGANNDIYINITIDNVTIHEELLRSVSTTGDIESTAVNPLFKELVSGVHTLNISVRRTGTGDINVSNIDLLLIRFLSNQNNIIRANVTNVSYYYTGVNYQYAYNYTFNKTMSSNVVTMAKINVNSSAANVPSFYLLDKDNNKRSSYFSRRVGSSTSVGTTFGVFHDTNNTNGVRNFTIASATSSGVSTVTGAILTFSAGDQSGNLLYVQNYTNQSTNLSSVLNYTAGTHLVARGTINVTTGNQVTIIASTTAGSLSGAQTVQYFINSTNLSESQCYSKKFRSLGTSADETANIMFTGVTCPISTAGVYTFNLYAIVSAGETLVQKDEEMVMYETTSFSLTATSTPPLVGVISTPSNNDKVLGSVNFTWTNFTDLEGNRVNYNITLFKNNVFNLTVLANTTDLNYSWNSKQAYDGEGTYVLFACDSTSLCSNASITLTVVNHNLTITTQSPINSSNYSVNNVSLNYVVSGYYPSICSYSLDGKARVVLTNCANTTIAPGFGKHYINISVNNSVSYFANATTLNFTVDVYAPIVSIEYPENNTNYTVNTLDLNFTVLENLTAVTCAYSLDGAAYVSIANCANTSITVSNANHNLTLRATDTVGNNGTAFIRFLTDSSIPRLTVQSPSTSVITPSYNVSINFTTGESFLGVTCSYVLDNGSNVSIPQCRNTSVILTKGLHHIIIYANDSLGNLNASNNISFLVADFPLFLNITSPLNNSLHSNATLPIRFTTNNIYLNTCWYSINNSVNNTIAGCNNFSLTNLVFGNYNLTIYANDTWNNFNYTWINFSISSEIDIRISSPLNKSSVYSPYNMSVVVTFPTVTVPLNLIACNLTTNYTYIEYTPNATTTIVLTPPVSGIYNISVNCTQNGLSDVDQVTVGYLKIRTYNISFTTPDRVTYTGLTTYLSNFYSGYLDYLLGIFVYAIAFLVSRNYQTTLIAGGVGLFAVFFITSNPVLLAGGLLSVVVGYVLKYAGG